MQNINYAKSLMYYTPFISKCRLFFPSQSHLILTKFITNIVASMVPDKYNVNISLVDLTKQIGAFFLWMWPKFQKFEQKLFDLLFLNGVGVPWYQGETQLRYSSSCPYKFRSCTCNRWNIKLILFVRKKYSFCTTNNQIQL